MCSFKGLVSSWNNNKNQQKQKELLQIDDHIKDLYIHLAIGFIVY